MTLDKDIMNAEEVADRYERRMKANREQDGDCISRQYLLDNYVVDKVTMPYVPVSKIENAPSVTPKQKMGYWISIDDTESECSECGHREPNERFIFEDINFCAKCGARMEAEDGNK